MWLPPTAIDVAAAGSATGAGVRWSVVVPSPRWPLPFVPQVQTVLDAASAAALG